MKHKIYLLLFICLNCFTAKSQNLFVADYGLYGDGNKSLICYDHTFFKTNVLTPGFINVMKTDSAGNVLWSNEIEYPNGTFFSLTDIAQAADSGFLILLNWWWNSSSNHSDPTVTKLDKDGNHEWTRTYISVLSAYGLGIIKNNDNGFMVVGSRQLVDFVMKCDAAGTITWIKQFDAGTPGSNYDIATHDYNRFVVTGRHGGMITFFQTDLSGNLYWHTTIAFIHSGLLTYALKPLANGGYAATGNVNYTGTFSYDNFLLKADSTGAVQWLKIYAAGSQGSETDVAELPDSSLLMVGRGQPGGLALKTDKDGNFQFAKTETVQGSYFSVNLFSPGAVLLSGKLSQSFIALADTACSSLCNVIPLTIQEYTPVYTDTLLNFAPFTLPFADDTAQIIFTAQPLTRNVLCGFTSANENVFPNEINMYPNPVKDKLNITISNSELTEIIIYDMASRKLLEQRFINTVIVNTAQLAKGIYLYEVRNKNGMIKKGKIVKE